MGVEITLDEVKALKGRGFLRCKDGTFAARIVTKNGVLTSAEMKALAEASEKFGNGKSALTIRMSVEIQGIPYESIDPMCEFLAGYGLYPGGTGPKIRPIVCCKGTVCTHGLIDTQGLAEDLYNEFYLGWHQMVLPSKFKIAIGGCPNNCIKPQIHDFGIMGAKAFDANTPGYKVMLGGMWGKKQRTGDMLPEIYTKKQVKEILTRALKLWMEEGTSGERFGAFVDRIGFEEIQKKLKLDDLG